jgi:hypothetical protein
MTSSRRDLAKVEGLMTELLASRAKSRGPRQLMKAGQEVKELASLDYAQPLRKCLSRVELDELIRDARKSVWPNLNRESLRLGSTVEFSKRIAGLGVEVRSAQMSSTTGLALLGFYVRKAKILSNKPLICVNTAHHPAAVGAAFVHEMGHHLTSDLFGLKEESPSFMMYSGYADHLGEPSELVADILVSLGVYPQTMARKMFPKPACRKFKEDGNVDENGGTEILEYLAKQYGLSFDGKLPAPQKFQYLAGLLHYTKLREALRHEYDL